jgi:hypothetical protein
MEEVVEIEESGLPLVACVEFPEPVNSLTKRAGAVAAILAAKFW